jgi:hypothetical protein
MASLELVGQPPSNLLYLFILLTEDIKLNSIVLAHVETMNMNTEEWMVKN